MNNPEENYFVDDWKINPMDQYLNIKLKRGDYVRIGKVEGFWVFVDRIMSEDTYSGIISNFVLSNQDYNIDDRVIFRRKHIFDHKKKSSEIVNT